MRERDPYRRVRILLASPALIGIVILTVRAFTIELSIDLGEGRFLAFFSLVTLAPPYLFYVGFFRSRFGSLVVGSAMLLLPVLVTALVLAGPTHGGAEGLWIPVILWGVFFAGVVVEALLRARGRAERMS